MATSKERVEEIVHEFKNAAADRGNFEAHWEEVAALVLPDYSELFQSDGRTYTTGEKRNRQVYDATAVIALPRFAAVMESMLTPRGTKWHRLAPLETALLKDRAVLEWMEQATDVLFRYRYAPEANFAGQNNQNYLGLGAFGTCAMFTDELAEAPGLRYKSVPLSEVFFFENHQGAVDKAMRRFELTARQAAQQFGSDKLPQQIQVKVGTADQDIVKFLFLHAVTPNKDVDTNRADFRGMRWSSNYIALDQGALVREGGYRTFPYAIGRHTQAPGEVYGRSVAMQALPAIKTLNEQKKTMLRQGHRVVDPVLLTHDDGILSSISLRAGAVNVGGVNKDGRPLVHTLPTGSLAAGDAMMEMERNTINDAFLVTLFQILTENPQMTATEVIERVREKGVLLSPAMGRQQTEYLGPMIERELDVLSVQGLLPPVPPALREAGNGFKVEYDSPLSRAQRAEEASGFIRWAETSLKFAAESQNPEILDWIDVDSAQPELASIYAVPVKWVRTVDQVAAIRDQRTEAANRQEALQAAPGVAQLAKAIPGVAEGVAG